jgi:LCP family protein required for cell wall assembly
MIINVLLKDRFRIVLRTKGDAIFLAVSIAFGIIASFVLTALIAGYVAYLNVGGEPKLPIYIIGGEMPPARETADILGRDQLSVLIIGTDELLEYDPGRSDTIIWAFLDFREKTVDVVSIPRDMIVYLPRKGGYFDKICHAYSYGGVDLVHKAVEGFLGVKIDQVVKVNYGGFVKIIDTLGGVRIDVENNMRYDDRAGNLHIDIKKGLQILDGRKSLEYVRFRHDKKGDLGRIERQQKFMEALREQGLRIGQVGKIDDVAKIVEESINLDPQLQINHIASILVFFAQAKKENIRFHSVPIQTDIIYNKLASLAPDYAGLDDLMSGILAVDESEMETISSYEPEVSNGIDSVDE